MAGGPTPASAAAAAVAAAWAAAGAGGGAVAGAAARQAGAAARQLQRRVGLARLQPLILRAARHAALPACVCLSIVEGPCPPPEALGSASAAAERGDAALGIFL